MHANINQFLASYGLPLVFGAVFVEQIGVPLPAIPWLLAVGAPSGTGRSSAVLAIALTLIACLVADAIWFYLGRYRGNRVLGFLCRISLEPDSCVRRTENMFTRYGLRSLVVAKFLPGFLSTVAPPLAGMSKLSCPRFLRAPNREHVYPVWSSQSGGREIPPRLFEHRGAAARGHVENELSPIPKIGRDRKSVVS